MTGVDRDEFLKCLKTIISVAVEMRDLGWRESDYSNLTPEETDRFLGGCEHHFEKELSKLSDIVGLENLSFEDINKLKREVF